MPHFSKDVLDAEPESLTFLHEILHGPSSGSRAKRGRSGQPASTPSLQEGRFLGRRGGSPVGNTGNSTIGGNPGRTAPIRRRPPASLIGA